jgi:hypothetical protein
MKEPLRMIKVSEPDTIPVEDKGHEDPDIEEFIDLPRMAVREWKNC